MSGSLAPLRSKCDRMALLSYVCPDSTTITGSRNMVRVMGHKSSSGSASRSASRRLHRSKIAEFGPHHRGLYAPQRHGSVTTSGFDPSRRTGREGRRRVGDLPQQLVGSFRFANDLIAGFLEAVSASNELERYTISHEGEGEEEALRRVGEYVRGLRGLMAVGIAPMPGTKVQSIEIDGRSAVWLTPDGKSWDHPDAPRRTVMWMHGGAFILCSTNTHARLLSSLGIAAGAKGTVCPIPACTRRGQI